MEEKVETEDSQADKVSSLLDCSIAEDTFIKNYPCMYEGKIACRECLRDECDMAAGRKLHQEYFMAGWLRILPQ